MGFSGDGGPAINANIYYPSNVAVDRNGNIYIVDKENHRIRRVAISSRIITTVAGSTIGGITGAFSGDGGLAINARLRSPSGIVVERNGNLLIADTSNHRIRRINLNTGIITTIVGSVQGSSGDGGLANRARLSFPTNLAIDNSGNIYISDTNNNCIRRIDAVTNIISTIAGYGWHILGDNIGGYNGDNKPAIRARLNNPFGIAVDNNRNVFICDYYNHRIRRVDANGTITTVAGNGSHNFSVDNGNATTISMPFPMGITLDTNNNNLYIVNGTQTIRRLSLRTGIINTVVGYDIPTFSVNSIAFDPSGNMIISDGTYNCVRKISGPFR